MGITAVWGPPRSGKTTLSVDLAHAASERGRSVCLISPEPYSELTAKLGIRIMRDKSLDKAYGAPGNLRQTVTEADELFYVLAAPWDHDAFGDEPSPDQAKELLRQAEGVFDLVIADCPATGDSLTTAYALNRADRVIMLSGSDEGAAMWYGAFRKAVNAVSEKTLTVCDGTDPAFDYLSLCKLIGKKPDLFVPYFPGAERELKRRKTLYGAGGRTGRAYAESVRKLLEEAVG